jgi:hypothetical protein
MMFLKACFVVLCAAILPASASAFAPAGAAAQLYKQVRTDTIFVRSRDRDRSRQRSRRRRRRGRRDGHRGAPPGWHRYRSRPRDWQRRGCITIGPFWFCP